MFQRSTAPTGNPAISSVLGGGLRSLRDDKFGHTALCQ